MRILRLSIGAAAMIATLWIAAPVRATGYWNVPSTFCQCMGCGWGAGYHTPLVLGPITCNGWCSPNEIRLPYSPAPVCGCYDCGNCGCDVGHSRLEAAVVPRQAVAAPMPVSAIFAAPSERSNR